MFSFLPPVYKEKVEREYKLRLWSSVFFMLGCVTLASAALVFPAFISAKSAQTVASTNYIQAKNSLASVADENAEQTLSQTKTYMTALEDLVPLNADVIVTAIEGTKQNGISITSLSIGDTDNGVGVSVGGVAGTRNELIAFSNALQNDADFSSVNLPVDDLAQDANIDYTISLLIKKQSQ